MSSSAPKRIPNEILDDAATWFVEFSEGEVDQTRRQQFINWLRVSPEHIRAYLQIASHWEDARVLGGAGRHDIEELIAMARADTNVVPLESAAALPRSPGSPALQGRRKYLRWYGLVATVLLAVPGVWYWYSYEQDTYTAAIGEQRSITLADESTVELNSHTRIRVRFTARQRNIELLEGQALFRVAHDPARPFIVRSDAMQVRAVGTRFDVYRKSTGTVVTVLEGKVAVAPVARQVNAQSSDVGTPLLSGEQLTVSNTAQIRKTVHPDIAATTAWMQRQILLRNTPLSEVVVEFNRYSAKPLVITDTALNGVQISGVFSSSSPGSLVRGLDGLGKFDIRETSDRIEISAR